MSLIEILIAISIILILTTIALSGIHTLKTNQQQKEHLTELIHLLRHARASATATQKRLVLCPLNIHQACQNNWAKTLTLFEDDNENGQLDLGERVLKRFNNQHAAFHYQGLLKKQIIYKQNGSVTPGSFSHQNVQLSWNRFGNVRRLNNP